MAYLGIIIEQSLKDASVMHQFTTLAEQWYGSWRFLLVSVPEEELERKMKTLQDHMIDLAEDCWYAHFFQDETLYVVYQDAVFRTTLSPDDWDEPVRYGLSHNVPIEQLDFKPRTVDDACAMFGLDREAIKG